MPTAWGSGGLKIALRGPGKRSNVHFTRGRGNSWSVGKVRVCTPSEHISDRSGLIKGRVKQIADAKKKSVSGYGAELGQPVTQARLWEGVHLQGRLVV